MSVNTKAGFSIFTYFPRKDPTGAYTSTTIPHGLSKAPSWFMIKSIRNNDFHDTSSAPLYQSAGDAQTHDWMVWHKSLQIGYVINLNNVSQDGTSASFMNSTLPTNQLITLGSSGAVMSSWTNSATEYVCYAWEEIEGYSKFGTYNPTNPFVYLGFKPAWLMIRSLTGSSRGWMVWDNKRETFTNGTSGRTPAVPPGANPAKSWINAQGTTLCTGKADQYKYGDVDMLSNGFKIRMTASGNFNLGTEKHIYMAFAELPSSFARGF